MNREKVAKEWNARGFSCGLFEDPPGQRWEDYVHDVDELFMVIEGNVEVEIDGKKLNPKPGEEVFIPAQVLHSVRNIGKVKSRWLYGYKEGE